MYTIGWRISPHLKKVQNEHTTEVPSPSGSSHGGAVVFSFLPSEVPIKVVFNNKKIYVKSNSITSIFSEKSRQDLPPMARFSTSATSPLSRYRLGKINRTHVRKSPMIVVPPSTKKRPHASEQHVSLCCFVECVCVCVCVCVCLLSVCFLPGIVGQQHDGGGKHGQDGAEAER